MSAKQLMSQAQEFIVVEPDMASAIDSNDMSMIPLEVIDEPEHFPGHEGHFEQEAPMEVNEPLEVSIVVDELPGAPAGTRDPEEPNRLEVSEDDTKDESKDENDAKPKKNEKWDWESKGAAGFITWIKERIGDVPKHSGYDSSGLERALSYLEKLDNEISRAMRLDLDGELDANKVEEVRAQLDDGISRLNDRLDKVKKHSKSRRKKKTSDVEYFGLVKEAQKITGVQGTFVTVPILISGIARVCINGMVSAGFDIEHIYADQCAKYKLDDRERAEVRWLLFDMGFPMRGDRGFMPDEDQDPRSGGYDHAANYSG